MRIDPAAIRSAYQIPAREGTAPSGRETDAARERRLEQRIEVRLSAELARIRQRLEAGEQEGTFAEPGHILDILA